MGYTLEDLTDSLGLSPAVAAKAMAAADESALLEAAEGGVEWEGSALLDLATGIAIDDIREKHGFTDKPVDTDLDEDQQIIRALERPASKMQFAFIEDNEELRRVIEGGDFAAWRIFLHPEQRKYVVPTSAVRSGSPAGREPQDRRRHPPGPPAQPCRSEGPGHPRPTTPPWPKACAPT